MSYLFNSSEILQTIDMINQQHLDVRTITMGISLLDCASESMDECCRKIYDKICRCAGKLVETGCAIERELGIPIVNKRISVSPDIARCRCVPGGGLYPRCPDARPRRARDGRELHRRLLGACAQGLYEKRPVSSTPSPPRSRRRSLSVRA